MGRPRAVPPIKDEFVGADLGDARRSDRLVHIAAALDRDPRSGFPQSVGTEADLEGFYRFINNDAFSAEEILAPHVAATFRRAASSESVVVVHDTTPVEMPGAVWRKGLGVVSSRNQQGFLAHVALMLSADGAPLGVAHLETLTRSGLKRRSKKQRHHVCSRPDGSVEIGSEFAAAPAAS